MNFLGKKMNSVYKPPWDLLQVVHSLNSMEKLNTERDTLSLLYLSNGLEGNKHFLLCLHNFIIAGVAAAVTHSRWEPQWVHSNRPAPCKQQLQLFQGLFLSLLTCHF